MVYFNHGAEWIEQSAKYFPRFVNQRDRRDGRGKWCPIDDMHMECPEEMLDRVVPETLVGNIYEFKHCSMFLERG